VRAREGVERGRRTGLNFATGTVQGGEEEETGPRHPPATISGSRVVLSGWGHRAHGGYAINMGRYNVFENMTDRCRLGGNRRISLYVLYSFSSILGVTALLACVVSFS
jgi:hypothetical protein